MTELLEWFPQLNVHDLKLLDLQSESSIFFIYVILGVIVKRSVYPLAFFMCFLLVNASIFQTVAEWQVYLLVIVIYSYVFDQCPSKQSKYCCVTICLLSLSFSIDAFLYGVNGVYGTSQTLLWESIELLATSAHFLFICSLLPVQRIYNNIRDFFNSIGHITSNSDYILVYWYNVTTAIK